MNYRFQKFTTIYPEFLQQFLAVNPGCEFWSYQELYERFTGTGYGLSNFFAQYMQALGHEAQDLFASFKVLQKAWARDNRVPYSERNWQKDIIKAQVRLFEPDVLFLQDLYLFNRAFREELRAINSRKVLMIGWRGAPLPGFSGFEDLDLVLVPAPHFVTRLRHYGANAVLFPLGFEHTILDVVHSQKERDLDLIFIGGLGADTGPHSQRYALIEKLLATTPLQVWGREGRYPGNEPLDKAIHQANRILRQLGLPEWLMDRARAMRRRLDRVRDRALPSLEQRYPGRVKSPVFGLDYFSLLARAEITLNCHADLAEDYAGNMRLFEATGMGACLLTEWKKNLSDLFEPEVEVVAYCSVEECIEKARYLLDHPRERQAIAAAGQRRTLRDHTFLRRVEQLDRLIRGSLEK